MKDNSLPAILFPAFGSAEASFSVASELSKKGYPIIAVTGDTASLEAARDAGFEIIETEKENALRAGLQYFADHMPGLPGVVTVDMNEGYSTQDILRVAEAMPGAPDRIVLASRVSAPHIGVMARLERFTARALFAAVHGRDIRDPWSGLRGIPARHVPALLGLQGRGARYEFNIALNLQHLGIKAANAPVDARYAFADGSGFRERALDILSVLFLPLKFVSASLAATGADYCMYIAFSRLLLPGHNFIALTVGRSAGAVTGYLLNRNVVFRRKNNTWRKELTAAGRFALLAAFNYGASWLLLYLLHTTLGFNDILSRMVSDAFLFILSYTVQREFIFHRKPSGDDSH